MAKKRKVAKPSPVGRKKATKKATKPTKAGYGKPKPKPKPKDPRSGLNDPKEVNLNPLKEHIRAYVDRLEKTKQPSPEIKKAVETLLRASMELTGECAPTMILPTP